MLGGFREGFADEGAGFGRVMKSGEDGEADVFGGVGNHAHDQFHAGFGAEVHHFANFWRAGHRHCVEIREIGEDAEAWCKVGEESGDVLGGLDNLVGCDFSSEGEEDELFGFVGGDENHLREMDSLRVKSEQCETPRLTWRCFELNGLIALNGSDEEF